MNKYIYRAITVLYKLYYADVYKSMATVQHYESILRSEDASRRNNVCKLIHLKAKLNHSRL